MTRGYTTFNVDRSRHLLALAAVKLVKQKTGREYTLSQFARDAFDAHIRSIAADYNDNKPLRPAPDPPHADATRIGEGEDPDVREDDSHTGPRNTAAGPQH